MIVEEKKAHEHICPQGMHSDLAYKETCIGSRCMAWRWDDIANPNWEAHNMLYKPDPRDNPLTIKSDTHGYCGLAGRP